MEYYWRLFRLAKPFYPMLGFVVVVSLIAQAVGYLPILAMKGMMDEMQDWYSVPRADPIVLYGVAAAVIVAWIISALFEQASAFVSNRLQGRVAHRLGVDTAAHMLRLSLGFHTRHDTSQKMNAVGQGTVSAHNSIWSLLTEALPTGMRVAIFSLGALYVDPAVGAVILVGVGLSVSLLVCQLRTYLPIRREIKREEEGADSYQDDSTRNIRLVKASAYENPVLSEMVRRRSRILGLEESFSGTVHRSQAWQAMARHGLAGIVLLLEVWKYDRSEVTIGTAALLVMTASQVIGSTESLVRTIGVVQNRYRSHVERLFELLDTKPDILSPANPVPLGPMSGSIAFENVSFAYPDTAGTIHGVSFYVPAGATVAIVGSTGGGKTTLMTLLLRGYDPHAGRILVDGKDLRDLDPAEYLGKVGVVMQGQKAFNMSVRDNIAFGLEDVTQEQVEAAARLADAHEFILGLKDGYDTDVGESGVRLSGGQDQRLSIARALVRNPRLLILDEPTSNVDDETEQKIMEGVAESLRRAKVSRTVFIIAHRLSTIVLADIVIVLEQGRIVQQGSYDELSRIPGPFRRRLERSHQRTAFDSQN